jgi:LysR family carnitine catabolism transcriptional activator
VYDRPAVKSQKSRGWIVPVIKDAQKLSRDGVAARRQELIGARSNGLNAADVHPSTNPGPGANAVGLKVGVYRMRRPKLTSLRLFMRVAHAGSFSEAARVMNTSQPALSRSIRLLEEQLGVRLFDRDTRNVRLTSSGSALLPVVERLTADFDQALIEVQDSFSGMSGRVVVGALPTMAASLIPRLIVSFQETHPLVDIIIRDSMSGSLYQQMAEREIDFAVTTPAESMSDFVYMPIQSDPCVLVCRSGDELDQPGPIDWQVFAQRPFIAMAPRSSVRLMTDTALAEADVVAKPLFQCSQMATVGALIAAGLGISALPLSTLPLLHQQAITSRPLVSPTVDRTIGVAHLQQRSLSPAAAAFMDHLLRAVAPGRS